MGTGYTRNDVDNNIADGNVINAADFDGEFNAIVTAFSTSGHTHDGTTAEGGPISIIGPGQDITVSATIVSPKSNNAIDLGTDALEFKDIYIAGVAYIEGLGRDLLVAGTNKIEFRDSAIHINSTADGELDIVADGTIFLTADAITFGEGTDTDIVLTFNANTADGVITWMEDEDYFQFSDDILLSSTEKVQFGDTASFIQQSGDGVLRIDGEATIDLNASTAVLVSHDLKLDSDDAILGFGVNNDVTLTHIPDAALLLNDAIALQFRDNALAINSSANGQLDIIADVSLEITTPILNFDTDGQVIKFGAGDDVTLTHVHDTGLLLNDAMKIQFNDASQFIHGSSATVLSLGATAEINLTATAIDINGTLDVSGDATFNGTTNTFVSATSTKPVVVIKNTTNDASASTLRFEKDRDSANGASGDDIGTIEFKAGDSGATQEVFASILGEADVATSGEESGKLTFSVSSHDGGLEEALILVGGSLDTEVDVTIAKGLDSVTNVTGHLNVGHDFDVTGDAVIDGTALVTGVLTTTAATVFNGGFAANDGSTISTADNTDTLSLISIDADVNAGPNLRMYRNKGTPANADILGVIDFEGRNNNSQDVIYAEILTQANVVTDGSEDGSYYVNTMLAGTVTNRMNLIPAETIFNEESKDIDFRVESNNTAHLLFADGGEDVVGIGTPTPVPSDVAYKRAALHIHQEQGGSTGSQIHMTNDATGAAAGNGMFIAMWQDDDVYFTNQESDGNIKFSTGGNNNVLVLNEDGSLSIAGKATVAGGISIPDTVKIQVGTNDDLEIRHDGNSVIEHIAGATGDLYALSSGDIYVRSADDIFIQPQAGENGIKVIGNGAVELYHDNVLSLATAASKVVVEKPLAVNPDTAGKDTFFFTSNAANDASMFLKSNTTNKVNIQANGATFFNGGNVGIGTAAPTDTLHIVGDVVIENASNAPFIDFVESGANTDSKARITMDQVDGSNGTLIFSTEKAGTLTAVLNLDQAGNVGIGTAAPSGYLATQLVVAAPDEGGITLAASATSHKQNIFFADGTSGSARNRGNLSYDHNNDSLTMGTAGGNARFLMDNTGAATIANGLTLTDGNLVVAASHGIDFSAADSGISGSGDNLLDEYEEGVHVTSFVCAGSGTITINSSFDTLFYTRIGRLVTINGRLKVSSVSSPVGAIILSLPFAALNIADTSCSVSLAPNTLASGSVTDFWGEVEQNGSRIVIYYGEGTSVAATAANKFAANTDLRVSVTYTAAA